MLIKISQKTNQWIKITTIVQIAFFLLFLIINFAHIILSRPIHYILTMMMELTYLLLLIYLIDVLFFLREKAIVVVAFFIYMGSDILRTIYPISMGGTSGIKLVATLGVLSFVSTIYLFIATYKIKSSYIMVPYRLFGFALLILTLLKFIITIMLPLMVDFNTVGYSGLILLRTIMNFINVIWLLIPISILFVVNGLNKFFFAQSVPNTEMPIE